MSTKRTQIYATSSSVSTATSTSTSLVIPPLHILSLPQTELPPTVGRMKMMTPSDVPSQPAPPLVSESTRLPQSGQAFVMRPQKIRRRIPVHTSFSRNVIILAVLCYTKILLLLPLHSAEKDSNPYPYGNNPNNQFKMYWNDAANVLQDLSKFSALFIKYHGCVWSECHVDQYDDDGENRDGDEYWYQYRTQPFCANAAYSLYGTLRTAGPVSAVFSRSCSRATYINSFFTYGGADTMFQALSLHSSGSNGLTTFDSMNDDESNTHPNSVCYTMEESNNNNNNNDAADGLSSTMGCSADMGQFVVAQFEGTTCDGNYFLNTVEKLPSYNRIIQTVRCKQIWNYHRHYKNSIAYINDQASGAGDGDGRRLTRQQLQKNMLRQQQVHREIVGNLTLEMGRELGNNNNNNNNNGQQSYSYSVYNSPAENLLANSWACDISVYPKGCPDPYGLKKKYDSILQAVAKGRNPTIVITNAQLKQPITVLSYMTLLVGLGLCTSAYFIRNQQRMKQMGVFPMMGTDLKYSCLSCCSIFSDTIVWCCAGCWACVIGIGRKFRRSGVKKSRKERMEEKAAKREARQRKKQLARKQRQFSFTSGGSGSDASSTRRGLSGRPASAGRALSRSRKSRNESNDDDDLDILPSVSNKTGTSRKSSKSHRRTSSGTTSDRKVRSKSSSRVPTSSQRHHSSSHYRNMADDDDDDEDFGSVEEQQRYVRNSLGGGGKNLGAQDTSYRSDIV